MNSPPTLLTFRQFAKRHPAFSEGSLRWMRFQQDKNGFQSAFKAVGRNRVLVDEGEFFRIIEEQNTRQPWSGGPEGR